MAKSAFFTTMALAIGATLWCSGWFFFGSPDRTNTLSITVFMLGIPILLAWLPGILLAHVVQLATGTHIVWVSWVVASVFNLGLWSTAVHLGCSLAHVSVDELSGRQRLQAAVLVGSCFVIGPGSWFALLALSAGTTGPLR